MGPFVGGAPLDDTYSLVTSEEPFKCALQLRNAKTLLGIESQLRKVLADSTALKYNGKLKLDATDASSTELDKEDFLLAVDEAVLSYGLQSFFYLPDSDGAMKYLAEESHLFTVNEVLEEHRSRLAEPRPLFESERVETDESIVSRYRCYDKYERFDLSLSRRILETLLSQVSKRQLESNTVIFLNSSRFQVKSYS